MKIILSTYNYYPASSGGTEVYTKGLGNFLKKKGHEIIIIAAAEAPADIASETLLEDDAARAIRYAFEGLTVVGIALKDQSLESQYTFAKDEWTAFYKRLLPLINFDNADVLVMNGISGVSGLSLAQAFCKESKEKKIAVIVHTPFFCAKGDLLFANTRTKCNAIVTPVTCGNCQLTAKSALPYWLIRAVSPVIKGAGKLMRHPLLGNIDGLLKKCLDDLGKIAEMSEQWIVFSSDMAGFLKNQTFPGASKLKVIRHGIDTRLFNSSGRSLSDEIIFVYAGRFEEIKGVKVLADAWLRTEDNKARKRLLLAGGWNKSACGKEVYSQLSGRQDVEFLDNLNQVALAGLYKKAHCVIVPSRWIETGPLIIHEAVASGCDVITSDVGGQKELADFYVGQGTKFKNGDAASLAIAIREYKSSGISRENMVTDQELHYEQVTSLLI